MSELLPLALAIAASPFTIIPAILLLLSDRPRPNGWAFLAAWIVGVSTATGVFVAAADLVELADESPTWAAWVRITLGVILVVMGIRRWLGRRKSTELPSWMSAITTATPKRSAGLALTLSLANPKILVLAAAAGVTIASSSANLAEEAASVLIFALVGSITVALPVLAYTILGERIRTPLSRAQEWLERNSAALMAAVFVIIGAVVAVNGVAALA